MRRHLLTVRLLWGNEGRGTLSLGAGFGVTFALAFVLQLVALRALGAGDYASFVFALGLGNVANALATAIQPVVALRMAGAPTPFMPCAPVALLLAAIGLVLVGTVSLGAQVGWGLAALATVQLPLHAAVGVGLGNLQAGRAFAQIARSLAFWASVRVGCAALVVALHGSGALFVASLPIALLAQLLLLVAGGAYDSVTWARAGDSRALLGHYGLWVAIGWLVNNDTVMLRLLLRPEPAGAYATALTLGRIPVYVAAPVTIVLLPVVLSGRKQEQRARLWAIMVIGVVLLAGTFVGIGLRPALLISLLAGHGAVVPRELLRGYAIVGPLAATATLLVTFTFALGVRIRARILGVLAVLSTLTALAFVRTPHALLAFQGAVMTLLLVWFLYDALRATRANAVMSVLDQPD